MAFKLSKINPDLPNEQQEIQIIENSQLIIGTTTLEEIQKALDNHKVIYDQETKDVADLNQQLKDAKALFKK